MFKSYALFWEQFKNFKSTSTRRGFWWAFFWNWLIRIALLACCLLPHQSVNYGLDAFLAYTVMAFIPSLALITRRYNDAGIKHIFILFTCICPYVAYALVQVTLNNDTELGKIILNLSGIGFFVCLVSYIILPMFPSAIHHHE